MIVSKLDLQDSRGAFSGEPCSTAGVYIKNNNFVGHAMPWVSGYLQILRKFHQSFNPPAICEGASHRVIPGVY